MENRVLPLLTPPGNFLAVLTELVPQLPTLVRHPGALLPPQREAGVGHELLRDERQHAGAVGVSHPQHLPHLEAPRRKGWLVTVRNQHLASDL